MSQSSPAQETALSEKPESLTERRNRCFGEGCDARLAGKTVKANPYYRMIDGQSWSRAWLDGYRDVEAYWGQLVRGRWQRITLPKVRQEQEVA